MIRIQIQLDNDQAQELRRSADENAVRRALAIIGQGASGCSDLAEEHDRYVADAIAERKADQMVNR